MTAKQSRSEKRRSEGEWRSLLARFPDSGMSVEAFCRRESISDASFYRWRARVGDAVTVRKSADLGRPAFVDLGVLSSAASALPRMELKLDLGGGVILHLVRG